MVKKTIKYVDFNDVERIEEFYFNLTKAEATEMEVSVGGGFSELLKKVVDTSDTQKIVEIFKALILKCYGEKSTDGKRFIKSSLLSEEFSQTEAYSELFMELATNADAAKDFVNGILPQVDKENRSFK